MAKRPIDRLRESAASMTVGDADDQSRITEAIVIDKRLHVVTEQAIYVVLMADDIDPERTNPSIPNAQQQVLNYGSDSPLVGRTLLTARTLFQASYLGGSIECEKAIGLSKRSPDGA